ncbi:MAG: BPL-N domain-containing protein [Candidatus Aquicultor sp.]
MNFNNKDHPAAGKIALFWDESFLWGIIAYETFTRLSINFGIVTSEDIRAGALAGYDIIFVPGGWASNKIKALGEQGVRNIRAFVENGGSYLGFCGGAGLALKHKDGISLVPVTRKPTSERVPSFSGKIRLHQEQPDHPIWDHISDNTAFHAWWPGQFSILKPSEVVIVASYDEPEDGSYVADLMVAPDMDWDTWERSYATNLNPNRIRFEPAVIEGTYGDGRVFLSYLHFETPGDYPGQKVLLNICQHLAGKSVLAKHTGLSKARNMSPIASPGHKPDERVLRNIKQLKCAAEDLIAFGEKNFLWYWRNDWILQWRRGVRGIEYCTLYLMLKQLAELIPLAATFDAQLAHEVSELKTFGLPFFEKAKQLLLIERFAMNNGPISPLKTDDKNVRRIREELFSNSKSFGGYYKQIIDRIDAILLPLLK